MWTIGLFAFVAFFFASDPAWAWGPTTHLEYSLGALSQLVVCLPWIRALLDEYAHDFLYGSIAADITLGKKYVDYTRNCHNWQVALDLFDSAKEGRQQAFMLGYLSHLAADTVSHNYFVPYYSMKSFRALSLRHTYWEVRMDHYARPETIHMVEQFADPRYRENDALLERELARTLFSFKTNKFIFNALLSLQRSKVFQGLRSAVSHGSDWELPPEEATFFRDLAAGSVADLMGSFDKAACVQADPTGRLKILYARDAIGKLKRYDKSGALSPEGERRFFADVEAGFRQGLAGPILLPEIENYL